MSQSRFSFRRWLPVAACVTIAAGILLGWVIMKKWPQRPSVLTTPDDRAMYQGHRFLMWVFDSKTHEVKGFADGRVRPGESAKWEAAGVTLDVHFGRMTRQEVHERGEVVSEYDAVDYDLRIGNTGHRGAMSLIWPFCHVVHGGARNRVAVVFEIPIGPPSLAPLEEKLPQKLGGNAGEVEGLVLASLRGWKFLSWTLANSLISIYQALGPTQRAGEWRELLHSGDPDLRLRAATVLTLAGNQEATEVFCRDAPGGLLAAMPPSEPILNRMVSLIVQKGALPTEDIGLGLPHPDARYYLIDALTTKYTKEDVRPYAAQLLRWAEDSDQPWGKEWAKDLIRFLRDETG